MSNQVDLLLQDICQRMLGVAEDVKNIKDKNANQDIIITNITRDIDDIKVELEIIKRTLESHAENFDKLAKTKQEVFGFFKYIKLVWWLIAVIVGYLSTYISINWK